MKSVYIDVLITVNVFIDFILILCTKKALCINTSFKKNVACVASGRSTKSYCTVPSPAFLFEYTYRCFMCRRNCVMCIRQVSV